MLTRQGVELRPDDPRIPKAKRELTVAPIDRSGIQQYPKTFPVWWQHAGNVVVPRFYLYPENSKFDFADVTFIDVPFAGALKPELEQLDATAAVMDKLQTSGGAILSLATGQGKTTCACWVMSQLGLKTVVLVHKDVLKTQWAERIAQFLPSAKISYVQGANCDTSGDVVIAMLQTLVSPGRSVDFTGAGLVVCDECFPYSQQILTDEGPLAIGVIYDHWKRGETVYVESYDETAETFGLQKVTHAWERRASELVAVYYGTSVFRATPNHLVLTRSGCWKETGDLKVGDVLKSRCGYVTVDRTERLVEPCNVYDLEVDTTHTFVCNEDGPVVHNCHHISAETFSTAMRGLCCPYSLGLSATPTRKDGLTNIMHWFLGPQAYVAQRKNMTRVVVELIKYTCPRYRLPPPMTRFGTVNHAAVLTDMADDVQRTQVIVDHILKLRQDLRRIVLVLSHRRDHCIDIAKNIPGAVAFLGGSSKKSSEHTTAPVVCATYALASEGYDDPRLNTLVLATPCSDVTQAAGRILRGIPTADPMIVDIIDDFGVAYAQAAKRKAYYAKAGFTYASQVQKEYPKCIIID